MGSSTARTREARVVGSARVMELETVGSVRGREATMAAQDCEALRGKEAVVMARPWWQMGVALEREGRGARRPQ